MNVYDSARMADVLAPLGYSPAPVPEDADMVILNTCHIRDKAAEKVFSELAGCGCSRSTCRGRRTDGSGGRRLRGAGGGRRNFGARAVCGYRPGSADLPSVARDGGPCRTRRQGSDRDGFSGRAEIRLLARRCRASGITAFLTIQEGCDQVLQLLRGALHTRRREQSAGSGGDRRGAATGRAGRARDHVAGTERQRLAWRGAGRRHLGAWAAAAGVGCLPGLLRLRYTTSHPRDMDES